MAIISPWHKGTGQVAITGGAPAAGPPKPIEEGEGGSLPFAAFKGRHPEFDEIYWRICRLLYVGGRALLGNAEAMERIFVRNDQEPEDIWELRRATAFYVNIAGKVIGYLLAGAAQDPIRVQWAGQEGEGDKGKPRPLDGFYAEFAKAASKGGDFGPRSVGQLWRDVLEEAFQVRRAWVELQMPRPEVDEKGNPVHKDLKAQEEAGELRTWAEIIPAEQVLNWECDDDGELVWALTGKVTASREVFYGAEQISHTFCLYTREGWKQWRITKPAGQPPQDTDPVPLVGEGPHRFGRVPLLRFTLPTPLWAMDRLESMARAHFNHRNTLHHAEGKSLWPLLYEFLGAELSSRRKPVSLHQQDPGRAVNTPKSPHFVNQRGQDDKASWLSPPTEPYVVARDSCRDIEKAMHGVLHLMSLAVDHDKASVQARSGESKREDKAPIKVILEAIGVLARPWFAGLFADVATGRGDRHKAEEFRVEGAERFDEQSLDELVARLEKYETITIPSPTAHVELAMRTLSKELDHLDQDQLEKIRAEMVEAFAHSDPMLGPSGGKGQLLAEGELGEEGEDEDEGAPGGQGGDGAGGRVKFDSKAARPRARRRK